LIRRTAEVVLEKEFTPYSRPWKTIAGISLFSLATWIGGVKVDCLRLISNFTILIIVLLGLLSIVHGLAEAAIRRRVRTGDFVFDFRELYDIFGRPYLPFPDALIKREASEDIANDIENGRDFALYLRGMKGETAIYNKMDTGSFEYAWESNPRYDPPDRYIDQTLAEELPFPHYGLTHEFEYGNASYRPVWLETGEWKDALIRFAKHSRVIVIFYSKPGEGLEWEFKTIMNDPELLMKTIVVFPNAVGLGDRYRNACEEDGFRVVLKRFLAKSEDSDGSG
jgi:hypothetical protein